MNDTISPDERTGYITGLRQLADFLEAHPDLPLPYSGNKYSPLNWILSPYDDQRDMLARFARALPGTKHKSERDTALDLGAAFDGLHVNVIASRDQVCERVVVGTETVEVPARPAQPATEAHTTEREIVEWRCEPLLAPQESARLLAAVAATPTGGA